MWTKRITNVNIIATYIHNNPGCRRTDIKRHLYIARAGCEPLKQEHRRTCNQYFQNYGSASNVYLGRLWYNEIKNMVYQESNTFDYWDRGQNVNRPGKSSYQLTRDGHRWVKSSKELIRPFSPGTLVQWQHDSPKRHGWYAGPTKSWRTGLVIERNKTYGMWTLGLDGKIRYASHLMYIRALEA